VSRLTTRLGSAFYTERRPSRCGNGNKMLSYRRLIAPIVPHLSSTASALRKLRWQRRQQFSGVMMTGMLRYLCCCSRAAVEWPLTRRDRDGFDADRRAQTVASSKTMLQRKSPPTSSSDLASKSLEPTHENPPVQAPTSSVPAAASTDKSAPLLSASTSYRPARVPVPAATSGTTSERFASRMRDGSDPDYDRHYGKYAPRNAVVPGAMSWPVMPTGGGYGMPVSGIPMGAPYEAMSPM
jgi:hypothetical protein